MDRGQFDALARLFSSAHSRRTALAAVIGAGLLGHVPAASLAKKKRDKAKAQPRPCYPGQSCTPGKGKNATGCDFTGSTVFRNSDVHGANLSNSNFTGADLEGAVFRGVNLSGACFVDASLRNATLDASVNLGGAVFCNTIMPDGSVDDSGCAHGTACCPTSCQGDDCPGGGGCQRLDALCGVFAGSCCDDQMSCVVPPAKTCQYTCHSDKECTDKFPELDVVCNFTSKCPDSIRCCTHATCSNNDGCPQSHNCCNGFCCFSGQSCGVFGCNY